MCRSKADGGRRCPGGCASTAGNALAAETPPGLRPGDDVSRSGGGTGPGQPSQGCSPTAHSDEQASRKRAASHDRRLTPRRLALLQRAAAHPKGSFIPTAGRAVSARDAEVLEALGYAASIDDCGHINDDPEATARSGHGSHPHFLRITPAGRAAAHAAAQPAGQ
jgi:hypothetical protein